MVDKERLTHANVSVKYPVSLRLHSFSDFSRKERTMDQDQWDISDVSLTGENNAVYVQRIRECPICSHRLQDSQDRDLTDDEILNHLEHLPISSSEE